MSQPTKENRVIAKLKTMIKKKLRTEQLKMIKLAKKKQVTHLGVYPALAILRRRRELLMNSHTGRIGSGVSIVSADVLWVPTLRGFR